MRFRLLHFVYHVQCTPVRYRTFQLDNQLYSVEKSSWLTDISVSIHYNVHKHMRFSTCCTGYMIATFSTAVLLHHQQTFQNGTGG